MRSRLAVAVLAAVAALAASSPALADYGWPIAPFDRPHPIRAFFDDPRIAHGERSFHFGVDIVAPDGTPVYAVAPGVVFLHMDGLAVASPNGDHVFGYWHVLPMVGAGQRVSAHQLLGYVKSPWGHVHFAERVRGTYVNPLRPGALTPFLDTTSPTIQGVAFSRADQPAPSTAVSGSVDVAVDAYDPPPLPLPAPWSHAIFTPALLRWRILTADGSSQITDWQTAADFRDALIPAADFDSIYAPETRQNRAGEQGYYRFYLLRDWQSGSLPDGVYQLEVLASDTSGNAVTATVPFSIDN